MSAVPNCLPLRAYLIQSVAGYTYLISFFAAAWAILCTGWMHNAQPCDAERIAPHGCGGAPIKLTVQYLILGMFCAGSVMISFGGVLGRISILQLYIMALLEVDVQQHRVDEERERETVEL